MPRSYRKYNSNQRQPRLGKLSKEILLALVRGSVLALEGVFYLAYGRGHESFQDYLAREYRPSTLYHSARSLERQGLIAMRKRKKRLAIKLTEEGFEIATKIIALDLKIDRPASWDGVWRMLAFDIPELQRIIRDVLRDKIKELGFLQVQKSLFVIPWPCRESIRAIQDYYNAHRYIKYLEVKHFDGDEEYRKKFRI